MLGRSGADVAFFSILSVIPDKGMPRMASEWKLDEQT
jgi:hypothetical protein